MATKFRTDDKDFTAARLPDRSLEEDEVSDLLVALRRQIDETEKLIARTGGLLHEFDVHQAQRPARPPAKGH